MGRVARFSGSLQVNRDWPALGSHSALPHYAGLHHHLRLIARLPADGTAPYPLMVFAGILPWTFFDGVERGLQQSDQQRANLISKVYFPRLIVPTSTVVVAFVDFLISFVILVLLMVWYQFLPDWRILVLPIFVLLAFFASIGPALWITALNVKYRDFRYVIPFIVQFGLYVSPVGFSSSVVPQQWRLLYSLNPMVGVIDGFRWCLLGGTIWYRKAARPNSRML